MLSPELEVDVHDATLLGTSRGPHLGSVTIDLAKLIVSPDKVRAQHPFPFRHPIGNAPIGSGSAPAPCIQGPRPGRLGAPDKAGSQIETYLYEYERRQLQEISARLHTNCRVTAY